MNKNEVKTFYETDAVDYDERWLKRGGVRGKSQAFIVNELTKDWHGKTIIELGCGTGRFSALVAEKAEHTFQLDIAMRMLNVARSKMFAQQQPITRYEWFGI